MPGGGAFMPGGIPIGGGGILMPGGIIPGGGGPLIGGPCIPGGAMPGMGGLIIPIPGAPTPLPGPASPAGAYYPIGASCTALPIGCAFPGPAVVAPSATRLDGYVGGASALMVTMFSPRRSTNPSALFYSRSLSSGRFGFIFLYSSVSASTRFMCLSKAIKVPTSILES